MNRIGRLKLSALFHYANRIHKNHTSLRSVIIIQAENDFLIATFRH